MEGGRALRMPRAASRAVQALDSEPLSTDEFLRRLAMPISDEEMQNMTSLIRWFLRRYPTARERLAYARRRYLDACR